MEMKWAKSGKWNIDFFAEKNPWYSLPPYLCRFKVQVIIIYGIASFSWKYDVNYFDFD